MFTKIKRVLKASWAGMFRDGGLIAANIFIMVMTISVITALFFSQNISSFIISGIQEKVDISVYFKYETEEDDILDLKEQISEASEVKEIDYVSKEEALSVFTERHKDDALLMESLEEVGMNPFLASLNIKAFEASQYEAVTGFLESNNVNQIIEKIDYHQRKPVIERIFSLTDGLNRTGIILSLIFAIIAVLVAFNSVRLSIYNSKEEISVQRLVGASNWFIRGPFLAQGAIVGFFSAIICFLLFSLISIIFSSKLDFLFPGLSLFNIFLNNFWAILLIQIFAGVGMGVLSSLIAIRRYLRV